MNDARMREAENSGSRSWRARTAQPSPHQVYSGNPSGCPWSAAAPPPTTLLPLIPESVAQDASVTNVSLTLDSRDTKVQMYVVSVVVAGVAG